MNLISQSSKIIELWKMELYLWKLLSLKIQSVGTFSTRYFLFILTILFSRIFSEKYCKDENMKNSVSQTESRKEISECCIEGTETEIITILQLESEKTLQELNITQNDVLNLNQNNVLTQDIEDKPDSEQMIESGNIHDNVEEVHEIITYEMDEEMNDEELVQEDLDAIEIEKLQKKENVTKKRSETALRRLHGKSYVGYKRSKDKVITHDCKREGRKMRERCKHTNQKDKLHENSFRCHLISENDRKTIFKNYWKLSSWNEKRIYVKGLVGTRHVKRRRKYVRERDGEEVLKKSVGHDYFLVTVSGQRLKVCRVLFLNTLSLGEDTLKRWTKPDVHSNTSASDESIIVSPKRKLEENPNLSVTKKARLAREIRKKEREDSVKLWLDEIPKVPSHYCRATSKMKYVDNAFISKQNMFKIYKEWCREKDKIPDNLKLFKSVLKLEKISVHKPRKDQCDTCVGFKVGTVSQNEYDQHRNKEKAGRVAKQKMKERTKEHPDTLVVTLDLQSVLTCPKVLASQSYYKMKLQLHNFTIYALNDKNVSLYVWHEASGGVTCNEFTSCLIDYLSNIPTNFKSVNLISDGCNYQNRNKTLASALSDFAKAKDITIQQLYLEKGHTMMEADSVHSTLEHYFHPPINSPTDYIARMRMARHKQPYCIKSLDYKFFKQCELASNFRSIRPGTKTGDPVVVDIRQLKYSPSGEVWFTLDYSEEWQILPHKRDCQDMSVYKAPLFKKQPAISYEKYQHLQEMKTVIEVDHHSFYDLLPHEKKKNKK